MKGSAAVRVGGFVRRAAGYIVVGMFGLIGAIMVVSTAVRGQALTAVALATLWLVPPVWVALRCRRGGRGVEPLLWAVLGLVCAASVVAAVTAQAWWDFANEEGPYFQVLVLVVGVCLAIWSLREPVRGGIAMIVLGVIPVMTLALVPPVRHRRSWWARSARSSCSPWRGWPASSDGVSSGQAIDQPPPRRRYVSACPGGIRAGSRTSAEMAIAIRESPMPAAARPAAHSAAPAARKKTTSTTSRAGSRSRRVDFGAIHRPHTMPAITGSATARTRRSGPLVSDQPPMAKAARASSSNKNRSAHTIGRKTFTRP